MSQVERLTTLASNKMRALQNAEKEAARARALQLHLSHLAKIDALKAELSDRDQVLFLALQTFYKQVNEHLKAVIELQEQSIAAAKEAQDLDVDLVPLPGMNRMGVTWQDQRDVIAQKLIDAYSLQFWLAFDARKNGVPVGDDVPSPATLNTRGVIRFNPDGTII